MLEEQTSTTHVRTWQLTPDPMSLILQIRVPLTEFLLVINGFFSSFHHGCISNITFFHLPSRVRVPVSYSLISI
jgi:hypothetical protein